MTRLPHNGASEKSVSPHGALDLAHIRREISIEVVARKLGLDVVRHYARCFREENHLNGDREPSLHFFERKNRAICFGCGDRRAFSNLDLVMGVLRCDLPTAIAWIREHFDGIPILRGRPAGVVRDKPVRVGTGGVLEPLIRSGVYATLSNPARSVLTVIRELANERNETEIPYSTLLRKTGIGSRSTIKAALDELTEIRVLSIHKGRSGILQPINIYTLTPEHPDLVRLMADTYSKNYEAIDRECEYRHQQKLARRRLNLES